MAASTNFGLRCTGLLGAALALLIRILLAGYGLLVQVYRNKSPSSMKGMCVMLHVLTSECKNNTNHDDIFFLRFSIPLLPVIGLAVYCLDK